MKKIVFTCVLIFFGAIYSIGQNQAAFQFLQQQISSGTNTPESYFRLTDSIMQAIYGSDTTEGGPLNAYHKFRIFYETRCAPVFDSTELTTAYHDALINVRSYTSTCGPDNFKGSWQNIGPRTDDAAIQNQGWVTTIWCNPGNMDHIRIGTLGAGVWETENGGTSWTNLTDNTQHLGSMGIIALAVNPNDFDEMYISTQMFERPPHIGSHYGMGIWHTTDAGGNWSLEISLYNADKLVANAIEFCPYPVNGQTYVVATITPPWKSEDVYGKLGTGSWVPLLTGSVNGSWCYRFTDIDFMPDIPGKFLISSEWPRFDVMNNPGVYQVEFNTTTGAGMGVANATPIVNAALNGNMTALACSTGTVKSFSTEYMGSGKIYLAYSLAECPPNSGFYPVNIAELNLNSPNIITNLVTGISSLNQFHSVGLAASHHEDMMYVRLGTGQANMVYKQSGVWHWKAISDYAGPDLTIHGDVRSVYLANDVLTTTNGMPAGFDQVVLWGTDGGISRTSEHRSDLIQTADNDNMETNTRLSENLNGDNLYLGNLWDADKEPFNKGYAASGWDNGTHYYNTAANAWSGTTAGDGLVGQFDKRRSDGTNFTVIKKEWSGIEQHNNPGAVFNGGSGVNQPEFGFGDRYSPIQYREDIMNIGIVRAWESNPGTNANPYFNGPVNTPSYSLDQSPNNILTHNIAQRWKVDHRHCVQFMVTPSNSNKAYYLLHGSQLKGILNKGIWDGINNKWDWVSGTPLGSDITPPEIWDINQGGFPGTDFCVDDKNEDRIFLALGGINAIPGDRRVLFSEDGGDTWDDMSSGLTELPVNCLVYQNGSDDVIYAGTDDGAYYWDKNLQCWIKMNGSIVKGQTIPNTVVTRLRIDYCGRKLIAATHGRGIWESELYYPNHLPDPTVVISTNTTWGSTNPAVITHKIIEGSIRITNNAKLTIQGITNTQDRHATSSNTTVYMPKWGVIHVEKGSELEVNGAHITNECSDRWYGIMAYGYGAAPQIGSGADVNHGKVKLNNAILQHAENAVRNFGGTNTPNTGGIIWVLNSHFINNRRSFEFQKYYNWKDGGILTADISYIKTSLFDVDDDIRKDFYAHISMWGVRGIKIDNDTFNNTQTLSTNVLSHKTCLLGLDASCYFGQNEINDFYKGVDCSQFTYASGPLFPMKIYHNTFDENEIGIHLNTMILPEIYSNEIKIGSTQLYNFSLGSKLEQISLFKYAQNDHTNTYGPSLYTTGTEVYNTGSQAERIHMNTYTDLKYGNDGCFMCGATGGIPGLRYTCNTNTGNNVTADFIFQGPATIAKDQIGNAPGMAAGNTFSGTTSGSHWKHYGGTGSNAPVNYFYSTGQQPTQNLLNVTTIVAASSNSCLPNMTNIARLDSSDYENVSHLELQLLKSSFNTQDSLHAIYNTLYTQLLDGGSTQELVDEIQNASIEEQLTTRSDFLSLSPYVSQDALRELGSAEVVSKAIYLEILLANPRATSEEGFITFLEDELNDPLPPYMIDLVRASWESAGTPRAVLEQNLSVFLHKSSELKAHILRSYLMSDTLRNDDSVFAWMQKVPNLRNHYYVIEHLMTRGDTLLADSLLDSLGVSYKMRTLDSLEYQAFVELYEFKKSLIRDSIEINMLDSTRIALLTTIADNANYTFPRTMARSALCFFYNICYPDTVREESSSSPKPRAIRDKVESSSELNVFPNPAKDYVVFYYKLEDPLNKATAIRISDIGGNVKSSVVLKNRAGQYIYDTRLIPDGTYIYTFYSERSAPVSGKFSVRK